MQKLTATARLNDGRANSALEKARSVGAPINQNYKTVEAITTESFIRSTTKNFSKL